MAEPFLGHAAGCVQWEELLGSAFVSSHPFRENRGFSSVNRMPTIRMCSSRAYRAMFVATLASLVISGNALADPPEACFYSLNATGLSSQSEGCRSDPLHVAALRDLSIAIKALALPADRIQFQGCAKTVFKTAYLPGATAASRRYKIYYPILDQPYQNYVAPLVHELAHVYQIETTGDADKLLQRYANRLLPIELGADFLTGIVARYYLVGARPNLFGDNLQLVGLYRESDVQAHGTPDQRIGAFRFGYFMSASKFRSQIARAYQEYDDNGFPMLVQDR